MEDDTSPEPASGAGLELGALEIGGGAAAGAIIGRILGGARATLIGAIVGAAAGTALAIGSGPARVAGPRKRPTDGRPAEPSLDDGLEAWTKARLYQKAKELEIAGRSRMNKAELVRALRRHPGFVAV